MDERKKLDTLFKTAQIPSPKSPEAPIDPESEASPIAPESANLERPLPEQKALEVLQEETPMSKREIEVINGIKQLREALAEVADAVYKIQLTEDQISEIAEKVVTMISDNIGDISIDRVKQLAGDLLLEKKRSR